ncbi:MAG: ATP-grasp domain-containing protein, partial [Pseudobutyrivibrio sp.]|nr:ATP-grasp domain-containing protein [Pseudobutyrivibrio sp.]
LTVTDFDNFVVQEFCGTEAGIDEITGEVFKASGKLHTIARRRLESKSGVCTKAEIVEAPELEAVIKKMVDSLSLPEVFNVQFVRHDNQWKLMDCNLRLAAGTGLSYAAGFQLIRGMFASFLGQEVSDSWFETEKGIKTILRVYREIVIRE